MRLCGMFILGLTFTCRKYFASKRGTPFITQAFWGSRAHATRTHKVHRGHPEQQVKAPGSLAFLIFPSLRTCILGRCWSVHRTARTSCGVGFFGPCLGWGLRCSLIQRRLKPRRKSWVAKRGVGDPLTETLCMIVCLPSFVPHPYPA